MRYFGGYSILLLTLLLAAPCGAFADTVTDGAVVTSKLYVDNTMVKKSQGVGTSNANVGKTMVVNASGNLELSATNPELTGNKLTGASNDTVGANSNNTTKYTSAAAVAEYAVAKAQGAGTNNANVGKGMVINSSGNLEVGAVRPTVSQANTGTSGYVVDSVAMDANDPTQINVTRSYVKIPVAAGAPSSNTPSAFAEIWLQ